MNFVPGRIEFLGKHTDYCGGESLVCPIGRGFRYDFAARSDSVVKLENRDRGEVCTFDLNDSDPRSGWLNYAATVAARLRSNFGGTLDRGIDLSFSSDLPPAAGLSSSSALMIMIFNALADANGLRETETYKRNITDELELAEYLGCIENGQLYRELAGSAGVGTFGGSQDHAAIVAGKTGFLTRFAFGPLRRVGDLALPEDYRFVVAASGVVAEKTGAAKEKYNRVSRMVSEIVNRAGAGNLAELIASAGMDGVERLIAGGGFLFSEAELVARVRQFEEETFGIIPKVAELIAAGRIGEIGDLVDRSQRIAESMLGNQIDETIFLQRSARILGAAAASAFGAGFGGSVYALVGSAEAEQFAAAWRKDYKAQFSHRAAQFFLA